MNLHPTYMGTKVMQKTARKQASFRGARRLLFLSVFFLGCLALLPSARAAVDEFGYDRDLVRALIELREPWMKDFAQLQIDRMTRIYSSPDQQEAILIEQARLYFTSSDKTKLAQAEEILSNRVRKDGPNARTAVLMRADMSFRRGDYEASVKAYDEFFKKYADAGKTPRDLEEYETSIMQYAAILRQLGEPVKVGEALKLMERIPAAEGEGENERARRMAVERAGGILAAVDKATELKKPLNRKIVEEAKAMAKGVRDALVTSDQYTAAAILEYAHACVILGQYDEALKNLNSGAALIKMFEEAIIDNNKNAGKPVIDPDTGKPIPGTVVERIDLDAASPKPGAFYYMALAQAGKARGLRQANPAAAEKLVKEAKSGALAALAAISARYPRSPYAQRAVLDDARIREEWGMAVQSAKSDPTTNMRKSLAEAMVFYNAKKYAEATPKLLEALRAGQGSPYLPETIEPLLRCYVEAKSTLQGEALVAYMADAYPAYDTPDINGVDMVGLYVFRMYQDAKTIQDPAVRNEKMDIVTVLGLRLLDMPVTHEAQKPKVAQRAYELAEIKYGRASDIVSKVRGIDDPKAKKAAKDEACRLFEEAIPFYRKVIEKFPETKVANLSCFKLAWIYYSLDRYREAADAFDKYAHSETDEAQAENRLQALYRAAESCILGSDPDPEKAVARFPAVLKELNSPATQSLLKDLDVKNDPAKQKRRQIILDFRDSATAYTGLAYHLWAGKLRAGMADLDARMKDLDGALAEASADMQAQQDAVKARVAEIKQVSSEYDEAKQTLTLEPGKAEAEEKRAAWRAQGMSEAEAAQKTTELQENSCKDWISRLAGEKQALEERQATLKQESSLASDHADKADRAYSKAKTDIEGIEKSMVSRQAQLASLLKKTEDAEKACVSATAEFDRLSARLQEIIKEQATERNPQKLLALRGERGKVALQKNEAEKAKKQAEKDRSLVLTDTVKRQIQDIQDGLAKDSARVEELKRGLPKLAEELDVKKRDAGFAASRLAAVETSLTRNLLSQKIAGQTAGTSMKTVQAIQGSPDYRKAVEAELEALKKSVELRSALIALKKGLAERDYAAAAAKIASVKADQAKTDAERGPRLKAVEEKLRLAEQALGAYLKEYPDGRRAPGSMVRLGSIRLELGRYDEAAAVFGDLATKYPGSDEAKTAQFTIGRAFAETGQADKAAAAFKKALAQPANLSLVNLLFIMDKLAKKSPETAYAAAMEVLKRGENQSSPDQALASRKNVRESAMVLAARAALDTGNPDEAIRLAALLEAENEKTAQYHEIRFIRADAYRKKTPPDNEKARAALVEVVAADPKPEMECRARLQIAAIDVEMGEKLRALGNYRQILAYDFSTPGIHAALETAAAEGARLSAALGDASGLEKTVKAYRELAPKGSLLRELENLKPADKPATVPDAKGPPPAKK